MDISCSNHDGNSEVNALELLEQFSSVLHASDIILLQRLRNEFIFGGQ